MPGRNGGAGAGGAGARCRCPSARAITARRRRFLALRPREHGTRMAHSWKTCAALSGLVGWSSQSFLWTLSISRGDMQATPDQLQLQPYLLPHRRIGCKLGCSSGETKNGHCALHFPAFLHLSGQRHSKPPDCLFQLATRDGRPPGPTLGDLRPVPRFTASLQESADGLLGAYDPLYRLLPVSSR